MIFVLPLILRSDSNVTLLFNILVPEILTFDINVVEFCNIVTPDTTSWPFIKLLFNITNPDTFNADNNDTVPLYIDVLDTYKLDINDVFPLNILFPDILILELIFVFPLIFKSDNNVTTLFNILVPEI